MIQVDASKSDEQEWGCIHTSFKGASVDGLAVLHVRVKDAKKLASKLAAMIVETSWMTALDNGAKLAYRKTVHDTASALVTVFHDAQSSPTVTADFGEYMVSIGSARALSQLLEHIHVPLAELWKPQKSQNEGFDFHTICKEDRINFGEAKYSSHGNAYPLALEQIDGFVVDEKHFRDIVHLKLIAPAVAVGNLEQNIFGVVAAFSINSKNPEKILDNAVGKAEAVLKKHQIGRRYLVGVSYDPS